MTLLKVLCLTAPIFFNIASAAESWRAFPTEAKNILFSVDEGSLIYKDGTVRFWERLVYVVPEKQDAATGKMVKEKRIHRIMRCKERVQAHLYAAQIADNGSKIEEIYRSEDKLVMTPIQANTIAEQELLWACNAAVR